MTDYLGGNVWVCHAGFDAGTLPLKCSEINLFIIVLSAAPCNENWMLNTLELFILAIYPCWPSISTHYKQEISVW